MHIVQGGSAQPFFDLPQDGGEFWIGIILAASGMPVGEIDTGSQSFQFGAQT